MCAVDRTIRYWTVKAHNNHVTESNTARIFILRTYHVPKERIQKGSPTNTGKNRRGDQSDPIIIKDAHAGFRQDQPSMDIHFGNGKQHHDQERTHADNTNDHGQLSYDFQSTVTNNGKYGRNGHGKHEARQIPSKIIIGGIQITTGQITGHIA